MENETNESTTETTGIPTQAEIVTAREVKYSEQTERQKEVVRYADHVTGAARWEATHADLVPRLKTLSSGRLTARTIVENGTIGGESYSYTDGVAVEIGCTGVEVIRMTYFYDAASILKALLLGLEMGRGK